MNDDIFSELNRLTYLIELHQDNLEKHEKQIGRLIQCIGEFDLNEQQRYYLHKAIWGDDDDK